MAETNAIKKINTEALNLAEEIVKESKAPKTEGVLLAVYHELMLVFRQQLHDSNMGKATQDVVNKTLKRFGLGG